MEVEGRYDGGLHVGLYHRDMMHIRVRSGPDPADRLWGCVSRVENLGESQEGCVRTSKRERFSKRMLANPVVARAQGFHVHEE